jgi:hypothetical protein
MMVPFFSNGTEIFLNFLDAVAIQVYEVVVALVVFHSRHVV